MKIMKDDRYKNLRRLAVNPLLLTIIAIVHRTRAVLPKERHKLYEECLKVMIELWNVANRKIDVGFSVADSLDLLAEIAVFLMKENRRELEPAEMDTLLPPRIENQPREFFIKEMVLKAGRTRAEILIGMSSPTSLGIDMARSINLTVLGFARQGRFNVYSGAERVTDGR